MEQQMAIDYIVQMIDNRQFRKLKRELSGHPEADIAELIRKLPDDKYRVILFRTLPSEKAADVFSFLSVDEQEKLLKHFTDAEISRIINEMSPDDRTELFEELSAPIVKKLFSLLSPEERRLAAEMLNYPEDSAGRIMTDEFIEVPDTATVQEAIEKVREKGEDIDVPHYVYIVDENHKPVGVVSLRKLVFAKPDEKVINIAEKPVIYARAIDDQEKIARIFKKYHFLALPIVDWSGRLVGVVTADDVVDIMEEEATEDFQKMAAITPVEEEEYFKGKTFFQALRRLPWLIALLIAETFSGEVIEKYSSFIASVIALSYFLPTLTATGGNVGSQSATVVVRGIATGEMKGSIWKILARELLVGLILGSMLAVIMFGRALITVEDTKVSLVVSLALLSVVIISNILGTILPVFFKWLKIDPAFSSSPLISTMMDIIGLFVYFEIATKLLGS